MPSSVCSNNLRCRFTTTCTSQPEAKMIILLISALLTFTVASLYIVHRTLNSKLHASHQSTIPTAITARIRSIPEDVLTSQNKYAKFYDQAVRSVPRQLLPDVPLPDLLTFLLRHNFVAFAHFPQAWILRLSSPSRDRHTFASDYVQSSNFEEGDRICGVYRAVVRTENQVELSMARGAVTGRLVIGYEFDEDKGMVNFSTETVMWMLKDKEGGGGGGGGGGGKIPLENPLLRFFHEMAAWWLMDSGVRFLMDLEGADPEEKVAFGTEDATESPFPFEKNE